MEFSLRRIPAVYFCSTQSVCCTTQPMTSDREETYFVFIWKEYINSESGGFGVFSDFLTWVFNYDNFAVLHPPCARCFFWTRGGNVVQNPGCYKSCCCCCTLCVATFWSSTLFISLFKSLLTQDQNNLVCLNKVNLKATSSQYLTLIGRQQQLLFALQNVSVYFPHLNHDFSCFFVVTLLDR